MAWTAKFRLAAAAAALFLIAEPAFAGEAEVKAAQSVIDGQLKAFKANDGEKAYSFAAPNIKQMFPSVESFMTMVTHGYPPVSQAQRYDFGKVEEMGPTKIVQQVLIVGPDGKDYEAVYTIEMQADGSALITGCSLKAANTLST